MREHGAVNEPPCTDQTSKESDVFEYFPGNYIWSSGVNLALMAGAQLGQIDHWLSELGDQPNADGHADAADWTRAWNDMARQQAKEAAKDVACGYGRSASARFLHASIYYLTGERQTPLGPEKTEAYTMGLAAFEDAVRYMPRPLERVEVESPDGILPGWFIAAPTERPAPTVIFYNGFDVTKEILYGIIRDEFGLRGMHCLAIDTPGTGEPLRLRDVASRPDYEVPTRAIVDYLETRPDVDHDRLGLLGISLGGYYAPRGAAFEHRIKAVAAWGGVWDYGAVWQHRWDTSSESTSVPFWQLPWVMGTDTMEAALERARAWTLEDAIPHLSQPLLIVHGENDRNIPLTDAEKAIDAAGSTDKELRIFTVAQGGAEHVNTDDPDPARQYIADWFARRLGTEQPTATATEQAIA
jgi:alpha-beta hydrolase superfamily lysophospholipase